MNPLAILKRAFSGNLQAVTVGPNEQAALASAGAVALVAVGAGLVLPTTGAYLVIRVLLVVGLCAVAAAGATRQLRPVGAGRRWALA